MANTQARGFICFDGYLARTAKLSDQELGRLFRACMIYHATGEVEDLAGRESVAFDFIREDIDAANEAYEAKCRRNKENIEKRWNDTNEYDRIRPNTNEENQIPEDTNDTNNNKNKNKNEKDIDLIDDDNARAIQSEQDQVLNAAEDAGFKMSNDVRASLIALYADHGLERMLVCMKSCVDHGATNLAYLRACLNGGAKKKPPAKIVQAQQYGQRDYSSEQDDAMSRMLKMMG